MDYQDPPVELRFQQHVDDPLLKGRRAPALSFHTPRDQYGDIKTKLFKRMLEIVADAETDD